VSFAGQTPEVFTLKTDVSAPELGENVMVPVEAADAVAVLSTVIAPIAVAVATAVAA
jgi:hypothetical protein